MKTEIVTIRLSKSTKENLEKVAKAHLTTISQMVREIIENRLDKELYHLEELDDIANAQYELVDENLDWHDETEPVQVELKFVGKK